MLCPICHTTFKFASSFSERGFCKQHTSHNLNLNLDIFYSYAGILYIRNKNYSISIHTYNNKYILEFFSRGGAYFGSCSHPVVKFKCLQIINIIDLFLLENNLPLMKLS